MAEQTDLLPPHLVEVARILGRSQVHAAIRSAVHNARIALDETSTANIPLLAKMQILRKLEGVARELQSAAYLLVDDVADLSGLDAGQDGG